MINRERLANNFLASLEFESESGSERMMAQMVAARLQGIGLPMRTDVAGNVVAVMPGIGGACLICSHLDTVTSTRGIKVLVQNGIVSTDGLTILGADDKAGVAAILEVVECLHETGADHRTLELVFTVGEERGLLGAKALDYGQITAREGICLDSSGPVGTIITQGPSQVMIDVTIHGRAAHAGISPELGINAIVVASEAIAGMRLGRIDEETTSNVGVIHGGTASNIVPEKAEVKAEARSHSEAKLQAQTEHMKEAFEEAAARHGAKANVAVKPAYRGFKLDPDGSVVQRVVAAARSMGIDPLLKATGGGSDANVFNEHGIKTVNLGVGYENAHAPSERIALDELARVAALLLTVVREP